MKLLSEETETVEKAQPEGQPEIPEAVEHAEEVERVTQTDIPPEQPDNQVQWQWKVPISLIAISLSKYLAKRTGDEKWIAEKDEVIMLEDTGNRILDKWFKDQGKWSDEATFFLIVLMYFAKRWR